MLLLFGVLTLMFSYTVKAANETEVEINIYTFPDRAFREYVLEEVDLDRNQKLSSYEVRNCKSVSVSGLGIEKLDGIEHLTDINDLDCSQNAIKELNLTKNIALQNIYCNDNQLEKLDLKNNYCLIFLYCGNNQLSELDLSKNHYLRYVSCEKNNIKQLDFTQHMYLCKVKCAGNGMTSLKIGNHKKLTVLDCSNNSLTKLDVLQAPNLEELNCSKNMLTKLDLSNCLYINKIYCYENNLVELLFPRSQISYVQLLFCQDNELCNLNVKNMERLKSFAFYNNHLWCVDVNDENNITLLSGENQALTVDLDATQLIDLSEINGFDVSKMSNLKNAKLQNGKLYVQASPVTYDYEITTQEKMHVTVETKAHSHLGNKVEKKDPTCGKNGNKAYYACSCGKWFWDKGCQQMIQDKSETVLKKTNQHSYDSGEVTVESTCVEQGIKKYTCQTCKYTKSEKMPLKDHKAVTDIAPASHSENGKIKITCKICKQQLEKLTIYAYAEGKIKGKTPVYDGTEKKPAFLVYDTKGNIVSSRYYTVDYPKAVKVGQYKVKIQLKELYQGTLKSGFYILPQKTEFTESIGRKKEIGLRWKKLTTQVDGYKICYSTDAGFSKGKTKTCIVKSKTKNQLTVKNLKSNTTYYVRMATYKEKDGKKYTSSWSKTVKVKVK